MTGLSGGDHPRDEGLDAVRDAEDVDVVYPAPIVWGGVPDVRRGGTDAGIVDQDVARAVLGEDRLRQCVDGGWIGNVGDDPDDRRGLGADQAFRCLVEQRLFDIGEDQVGTLGGERLGQRAADAVRTAGDDDDPAGEVRDRAAHRLLPFTAAASADLLAGRADPLHGRRERLEIESVELGSIQPEDASAVLLGDVAEPVGDPLAGCAASCLRDAGNRRPT